MEASAPASISGPIVALRGWSVSPVKDHQKIVVMVTTCFFQLLFFFPGSQDHTEAFALWPFQAV